MSESISMTHGPRWTQVRADEHLALCRVEREARDAVEVARLVGVHLGPLTAALAELTAARSRAALSPDVPR